MGARARTGDDFLAVIFVAKNFRPDKVWGKVVDLGPQMVVNSKGNGTPAISGKNPGW